MNKVKQAEKLIKEFLREEICSAEVEELASRPSLMFYTEENAHVFDWNDMKDLVLYVQQKEREKELAPILELFLQWFIDNETKIDGDPDVSDFVKLYLKHIEG